jgi:acyl-CoA thioesterase I
MNSSSLRILIAGMAMTCSTLFAGCQEHKQPQAAGPKEAPASSGTIVAVGDSLTAGYGIPESEAYPAQLERKLHQAGYRWKVVNAGISGETSSGTLSRIDWVLKLQPDIVILEIGANDGLRGVEPQLVQENIDKIVTRLDSRGVVVVLAGMEMLRNLGVAYTSRFSKIYPAVAKEHELILVPFFLAKVAGERELNLHDGIHPTGKGYTTVTDTVFPYVLKAIEKKGMKSS